MSRADQTLPTRELGPAMDAAKPTLPAGEPQPRYTDETYDDAIFDEFYGLDTAASQTKPAADMAAPPLPERNSMRASRLLDHLSLKLGGSMTPRSMGQTTPHDMYLSSEEDASSSADDFSDYDYDSASEDGASPRRTSHEVTARVVSVVFSGKPSIVDLSLRRPTSPSSTAPSSTHSRTQSTFSGSSMASRRLSTSTRSIASVATQPSRQSGTFASLLAAATVKKAPPFLAIDPYPNGSSYSLDVAKDDHKDDDAPRTPRTPTALLRGMSRTLTLVKKRSRPLLREFSQTQTSQQQQLVTPGSRGSMALSLAGPASPESPQGPVTYKDIIQTAKKNAKSPMDRPQTPVFPSVANMPEPPVSPSPGKKGFLGNLAARRRSIKIVNGKLL